MPHSNWIIDAYVDRVRVKLGKLRQIIREASSWDSWPGRPARDELSSTLPVDSLDSLAQEPIDTVSDPDGLPDHLLEPLIDADDCCGPVPPDAEDPYVMQDPYVRMHGPAPTSTIKRG